MVALKEKIHSPRIIHSVGAKQMSRKVLRYWQWLLLDSLLEPSTYRLVDGFSPYRASDVAGKILSCTRRRENFH